MKFELNKIEQERVNNFYKKCKKKTKGQDLHLSYHFFPTGIGTVVKIKSEKLGIEEDITDLDSW